MIDWKTIISSLLVSTFLSIGGVVATYAVKTYNLIETELPYLKGYVKENLDAQNKAIAKIQDMQKELQETNTALYFALKTQDIATNTLGKRIDGQDLKIKELEKRLNGK